MKALLILLALASIAHGRIGATLDECKQMYGKPTFYSKISVPEDIHQAEFKVDKITIGLTIIGGKVAQMRYSRVDEKPDRNQRPFSYGEFKRYRTINGGGRKWKRNDGWDYWKTTDGFLTASRSAGRTFEEGQTNKPYILFLTKKFTDWVAEEMADQ